jgi:hypothetical protein
MNLFATKSSTMGTPSPVGKPSAVGTPSAMGNPSTAGKPATAGDDDQAPLTPEQAKIVARVRWLMLISGLATLLGIAVVITVVGYRLFRSEAKYPEKSADTTALLPRGARIIQTAVAGDRIVVTVEIGGAIEIRTFDTVTLRPEGRLRFVTEP